MAARAPSPEVMNLYQINPMKGLIMCERDPLSAQRHFIHVHYWRVLEYGVVVFK